MGAHGPQYVAAFDLDGTLTRRDTLLPFLCLVSGRTRTGAALSRHARDLTMAVAGHGDRDAVKQSVLTRLLAGRPYRQVTDQAQGFAAKVHATGLRKDLLARWTWHRDQGHQLVIVSASLAEYLEPLGKLLGADAVLCSRLQIDAAGLMTGRLEGENCRGQEKVKRLTAWLGGTPTTLWAYGDSSGDRQLLEHADVPHWVSRRSLSPAGAAAKPAPRRDSDQGGRP